jgi:hypothetical protein
MRLSKRSGIENATFRPIGLKIERASPPHETVVSDSWWKLVLGVAPDHDGCAIRRRGQSGCLTGAWMVWRLHILLTAIPLTAIPAAQADAGQRHPQRSEVTDKLPLPLPVAVAIALGRAVAIALGRAALR